MVALAVVAPAAELHHVLRVVEVIAPVAQKRRLHVRIPRAQRGKLRLRHREKAERLPAFPVGLFQKCVSVFHVCAGRRGIHRTDARKFLAQEQGIVQNQIRVLKIRLPQYSRAGRIVAQARAAQGKIAVEQRDVPRRNGLKCFHNSRKITPPPAVPPPAHSPAPSASPSAPQNSRVRSDIPLRPPAAKAAARPHRSPCSGWQKAAARRPRRR